MSKQVISIACAAVGTLTFGMYGFVQFHHARSYATFINDMHKVQFSMKLFLLRLQTDQGDRILKALVTGSDYSLETIETIMRLRLSRLSKWIYRHIYMQVEDVDGMATTVMDHQLDKAEET